MPPSTDGLVRADADDTRQRLQALGYIGATGSSLGRQNLAESLFRRGKDAAAERELRTVIGAQPQNVAAQLWLAQVLARTGRAGEALVAYERAIALPDGARDALVEATELAVANKDVARAQRMIALVPVDEAFVHVARGAIAEAQRAFAIAEREYRTAAASLRTGVVHGDAHAGNLLRDGSGGFVLCDLDSTGIGPLDWDLVPAAVGAIRFGEPACYAGLVAAYGRDVTAGRAWPLLRRIRELVMVTSVATDLRHRPAVATEHAHRMRTLRAGDTHARWHRY